MTVIVRLFGTLSSSWPDYQHQQGLKIDMPLGSTALDLIKLLKIAKSRIGIVSMNGHRIEPDQHLEDMAAISIFQPISGG